MVNVENQIRMAGVALHNTGWWGHRMKHSTQREREGGLVGWGQVNNQQKPRLSYTCLRPSHISLRIKSCRCQRCLLIVWMRVFVRAWPRVCTGTIFYSDKIYCHFIWTTSVLLCWTIRSSLCNCRFLQGLVEGSTKFRVFVWHCK